jgi:subtilisin-like proprotein convertase family protein
VFNRPGGPVLPDDGTSCCGDSSNLLDFNDFLGDPVTGNWKVCLGDSGNADPGLLDSVSLNFTRVKYDPKG